jgi:hypothetical protein
MSTAPWPTPEARTERRSTTRFAERGMEDSAYRLQAARLVLPSLRDVNLAHLHAWHAEACMPRPPERA